MENKYCKVCFYRQEETETHVKCGFEIENGNPQNTDGWVSKDFECCAACWIK